MFTIDKLNKIVLTRGDTATIYIEVVDANNESYTIKSTDTITMTVKKTTSSATASITKTATEDHYIIINSSDTSSLDAGLYVYDIQLETEEGYIYTIVPTSYFELKGEIS